MVPILGTALDLIAPSLPNISTDFEVSPYQSGLLIPIFLYGYACGAVLFGVLSDIAGRKIPLLLGVCAFSFACLLAMVATNIDILLLSRFLQGVMIASVAIGFRSIFGDIFLSVESQQAASAYLTIFAIVSPIVAPFFGGIIVHFFNWRLSFIVLAIYGFIIAIFALYLPETIENKHTFVGRNLFNQVKSIFSSTIFIVNAVMMGVLRGRGVVFYVFMPFFIQQKMGYSSVFYGQIALVFGVNAFVASISYRFLLNYFPLKRIIEFNMLLSLLAVIILLVLLVNHLAGIWIILLLLNFNFFFFSCSGLYQSANARAMSMFPNMGGIVAALSTLIFISVSALLGQALNLIIKNSILLFLLIDILLIIFSFCLYFFLKRKQHE